MNDIEKLLKSMLYSVWILVFLSSLSCSSGNMALIGKYETKEPSFLEKVYLYVTNSSYFKGTTIELKSDSTFIEITCGNVINGYWYAKNDTILLKATSNVFRNDSLRKYGLNGKQPKIGEGFDTLFFKRDYLLKIADFRIDGKLKTVKTKFYKVEN